MAGDVQVGESVARRYGVLRPFLDERQRRLVLAVEAAELGRGGITKVALATGVHPDTIAKGVRELEGGAEPSGRVRAPGGGRKPASETDPGLVPALTALVDPETRGDPESPLVWTTKSTKNLADALTRDSHPVSDRTVARMLRGLGFSLQATAKVTEGRQHVDRDAQFGYLNAAVIDHLAAGAPVVSVDTKKKELVGEFHNGGREYQPATSPVKVNVHDFPDKELGTAIPYGIYDVTANTGWVSVGADHDTSAFAVQTLRRWWHTVGRRRYPDADRLLICADGGRRRRLSGPSLEDRTRRLRRRDRSDHHRLPPAAGHQQMEQDRTPAVLPDHPQLAGPAPDQPPDHRRPDRRHQHRHRAHRPRRT